MKKLCMFALGAIVIGSLLGGWRTGLADLPRFTEEREAAVLYFVKKHVPELVPLLEQLKKESLPHYQREISEIFQVTELLTEMRDDSQRHELELKIWIAENKAHVLVARLSVPGEEERKKIHAQLQEVVRQLVALDLESLELRADQLERELTEARDEIAKIRDNRDKHAKTRYEALVQKSTKTKK